MLRRGCVLLACALAFAAQAAEALRPLEIGRGVYVLPAAVAEPNSANAGRVVNTGFIVGTDGVIVIDSGANRRHGEAIRAAVRRVTSKPIRLLINTHPHPHNVLGNAAFAARGIPILATQATRDAMQARCPHCLEGLAASVGRAAMAGSRIRLPNRIVAADARLEVAGRSLQLLHFGHGHTEGDLLVLDEATGVLFAGDLVYREQVPHLAEADTRGWLAALERIAGLTFITLVPGRGPLGSPQALADMRRYLDSLRRLVADAYAKGMSADEAIAHAALPEFAGWEGYAARHGRNVQRVYFELEREDFMQVTP